MKASNVITAFVSISFLFLFSCNELENLNLTDVSAPIDADFVVQADTQSVEKTEYIDASTNRDFIENRSKIDNIEIYRLEYQLKSISPVSADSLIEGKIEFLNPVTNSFETLTNIYNKRLYLNMSQELSYDPASALKLTSIFKSSDPKVQIRFKALANKKPVDLTLNVKFYLRLKIKI